MQIKQSMITVLGVLVALATVASAQAQSTDKPDVHVGDRWYWQHTDGKANEKDVTTIEDVIEVNPDNLKVRARVKGRSGSAIFTYTRDWDPVDVGIARYDPMLQTLAFPLSVGKKWTSHADKQLFSNGKHGSFNLKAEVQAYEKVTVPAGTFDAYRVQVTVDATSNDEDANIGHTTETQWYAPEAKRYVKLVSAFTRDGVERTKDIYELADYSLR